MEQLLILMVVLWTAGRLFQRVRLPLIFGELLAGIIVGPALLDLVNPGEQIIEVTAELGIFFLMLHTGLKTDHRELLQASFLSLLVAVGGMALSFGGGILVGLAFGLTPMVAVFCGLCLSISALALMARVFKDCRIESTRMANVSMGAAVINDILGLIAFSVILGIAEQGSVSWASLLILLAKVTAFFVIVFGVGLGSAPYLKKFFVRGGKAFTLTLVVALLFGSIAELLGLHAVIGAFLAGVFMQEELIDTRTFAKIEDRFYGLAYSFFGPVFFASLAFHLDFTSLAHAPLLLGSLFAVGVAGKVLGSGLPALLRLSRVESLATGLAMNTRGAVELIIASVGLQAGIIDRSVFSMLITVAFLTTMFSILLISPLASAIRRLDAVRNQALPRS